MKAFVRPGDLRKTTKLLFAASKVPVSNCGLHHCEIEEVYSSLSSLEKRVLVEDDQGDMIKNLTLALLQRSCV